LVYYGEMDEFRQLVCRVSGPADLIDGFREKVSGEKLLDEEKGVSATTLVLRESPTGELAKEAVSGGLRVQGVDAEDASVYLTGGRLGSEIENLWVEKENEDE
nr:hypothetical protein [Eubacterium sp.]